VRIRIANPELKDRARDLRRASTPAETVLWQLLHNRSLGVRFRRQRPIGPYIVDFYCPERGLVIQIDGGQHSLPEHAVADDERTAYLEGERLRVLRFTNEEVMRGVESVLEAIRRAVSPSP
jgi:very-short-patch-repair endonuclease